MTRQSQENLCALCPKLCLFACPVATACADDCATPTSMMQAAQTARRGDASWEDAAEALDRCTGCEACRSPCEFDQDVPTLLYAARAEAWSAGAAAQGSRQLQEQVLASSNPFDENLWDRLAEHTSPVDFDRKGRVLYWPGCRALHRDPERMAQEMAFFRTIGAEHLSLPARDQIPQCCGAPLRVLGDQPGFQSYASALQQYFNRQRTWVSSSSSCILALRRGYPEINVEIRAEVLHMAEFLQFFQDALAEQGRRILERRESEGGPPLEVRVHDACGLHRRLGRNEAVYSVLEAALGRRPSSLHSSADATPCCGAGDFFDLRRPAAAEEVAQHGATLSSVPPGAWIVTGDTDCVDSLQAAYPQNQVSDLLGFLLERETSRPKGR